ncbi:uncharacterized protein LOC131240921 isoform X2 [Magnolia sinica]|uniref:uncharacterized protein LOC131240921 isoform X2 n=1 Tax=Magnolia sinica TaxID=86752 RepID=UPI002658B55C|nr:uncharacterized protein LOC131240921 isoform X2 [Magnolia sinica]
MATKRVALCKISPPLLLLSLLLLPSPLPVEAVRVGQWRTLLSLSHSLMQRVANARASRGDLSGADRARKIAEKLEGGFGFWRGVWSMGWDYVRNYAWQDIVSDWPPTEMLGAVSDMNELLRALSELTRMESDRDRGSWVLRNYQRVLGISKSLLRRFLVVFSRSVIFMAWCHLFMDQMFD